MASAEFENNLDMRTEPPAETNLTRSNAHPPLPSWGKAFRREIIRKIHQVGLWGTVKHTIARTLQDLHRSGSSEAPVADPFDSRYGTDTAQIVRVGALDIPEERIAQTARYQPVAVEEFEAAMRDVPINHEEYVFVDLGCGKGRALLLASRFPFKRVLGVEISAFLTGVAAENVRLFKDETQRCHALEVLCQDASTYELPRDRIVLHLYNPFGAEIMHAVVANAEESLRKFPRDIYVVYIRNVHEEVWNASALFRPVTRTSIYAVYRNTMC